MHRLTLFFAVTALSFTAGCDSEYKLGNENDDSVGIGDTLPPDIAVSPGLVTFDDINVTEPNAFFEQVVTISNEGEGELKLTGMELSDPNAPYSYSNVGSNIVAPGEFTEFIVTFSPETAGPTEATIYIDSNDPDEPVAEVLLGGLGIGLVPRMLVADALSDGRLVEILPGTVDAGWSIYAVTSQRRQLSARTRAFIHHLREVLSRPG